MNGGDKMLSNIEKETIILFNDAEDTASVYTCNNSLKNKLDRFCSESQEFSRVREDEYSKTYKVPKKCVKIYKPLVISEETRQKMALQAKERFHGNKSAVSEPIEQDAEPKPTNYTTEGVQ